MQNQLPQRALELPEFPSRHSLVLWRFHAPSQRRRIQTATRKDLQTRKETRVLQKMLKQFGNRRREPWQKLPAARPRLRSLVTAQPDLLRGVSSGTLGRRRRGSMRCPVCRVGVMPRKRMAEKVDLTSYMASLSESIRYNRCCPFCQSYVAPLMLVPETRTLLGQMVLEPNEEDQGGSDPSLTKVASLRRKSKLKARKPSQKPDPASLRGEQRRRTSDARLKQARRSQEDIGKRQSFQDLGPVKNIFVKQAPVRERPQVETDVPKPLPVQARRLDVAGDASDVAMKDRDYRESKYRAERMDAQSSLSLRTTPTASVIQPPDIAQEKKAPSSSYSPPKDEGTQEGSQPFQSEKEKVGTTPANLKSVSPVPSTEGSIKEQVPQFLNVPWGQDSGSRKDSSEQTHEQRSAKHSWASFHTYAKVTLHKTSETIPDSEQVATSPDIPPSEVSSSMLPPPEHHNVSLWDSLLEQHLVKRISLPPLDPEEEKTKKHTGAWMAFTHWRKLSLSHKPEEETLPSSQEDAEKEAVPTDTSVPEPTAAGEDPGQALEDRGRRETVQGAQKVEFQGDLGKEGSPTASPISRPEDSGPATEDRRETIVQWREQAPPEHTKKRSTVFSLDDYAISRQRQQSLHQSEDSWSLNTLTDHKPKLIFAHWRTWAEEQRKRRMSLHHDREGVEAHAEGTGDEADRHSLHRRSTHGLSSISHESFSSGSGAFARRSTRLHQLEMSPAFILGPSDFKAEESHLPALGDEKESGERPPSSSEEPTALASPMETEEAEEEAFLEILKAKPFGKASFRSKKAEGGGSSGRRWKTARDIVTLTGRKTKGATTRSKLQNLLDDAREDELLDDLFGDLHKEVHAEEFTVIESAFGKANLPPPTDSDSWTFIPVEESEFDDATDQGGMSAIKEETEEDVSEGVTSTSRRGRAKKTSAGERDDGQTEPGDTKSRSQAAVGGKKRSGTQRHTTASDSTSSSSSEGTSDSEELEGGSDEHLASLVAGTDSLSSLPRRKKKKRHRSPKDVSQEPLADGSLLDGEGRREPRAILLPPLPDMSFLDSGRKREVRKQPSTRSDGSLLDEEEQQEWTGELPPLPDVHKLSDTGQLDEDEDLQGHHAKKVPERRMIAMLQFYESGKQQPRLHQRFRKAEPSLRREDEEAVHGSGSEDSECSCEEEPSECSCESEESECSCPSIEPSCSCPWMEAEECFPPASSSSAEGKGDVDAEESRDKILPLPAPWIVKSRKWVGDAGGLLSLSEEDVVTEGSTWKKQQLQHIKDAIRRIREMMRQKGLSPKRITQLEKLEFPYYYARGQHPLIVIEMEDAAPIRNQVPVVPSEPQTEEKKADGSNVLKVRDSPPQRKKSTSEGRPKRNSADKKRRSTEEKPRRTSDEKKGGPREDRVGTSHERGSRTKREERTGNANSNAEEDSTPKPVFTHSSLSRSQASNRTATPASSSACSGQRATWQGADRSNSHLRQRRASSRLLCSRMEHPDPLMLPNVVPDLCVSGDKLRESSNDLRHKRTPVRCHLPVIAVEGSGKASDGGTAPVEKSLVQVAVASRRSTAQAELQSGRILDRSENSPGEERQRTPLREAFPRQTPTGRSPYRGDGETEKGGAYDKLGRRPPQLLRRMWLRDERIAERQERGVCWEPRHPALTSSCTQPVDSDHFSEATTAAASPQHVGSASTPLIQEAAQNNAGSEASRRGDRPVEQFPWERSKGGTGQAEDSFPASELPDIGKASASGSFCSTWTSSCELPFLDTSSSSCSADSVFSSPFQTFCMGHHRLSLDRADPFFSDSQENLDASSFSSVAKKVAGEGERHAGERLPCVRRGRVQGGDPNHAVKAPDSILPRVPLTCAEKGKEPSSTTSKVPGKETLPAVNKMDSSGNGAKTTAKKATDGLPGKDYLREKFPPLRKRRLCKGIEKGLRAATTRRSKDKRNGNENTKRLL